MSRSLFISDLHLAPERPEIIQLFERFLNEQARHATALYILGDLVEYWLGDDDEARGLAAVFNQLKQLSEHGVKIFFMHGNRDFLMGEQWAQRTGCTLLSDPCIVQFDEQPVLLMHGDTLCTDDVDYQKLRAYLRNPAWQQDFLSKPLSERITMAKALREKSATETRNKSAEIMDVNNKTVEQMFATHNTRLLIHGHTHRTNIHQHTINNKPVTRIVLGDWYSHGSYLEFDSINQYQLLTFQ